MQPTEPLPLYHSWPLLDADRRFDLGWVGDVGPAQEAMARRSAGWWECDLSDSRLTWSDDVYDLFGLPRGADLSRAATVAQYCEGSRAAMERLRAHAIAHRRGFTLDVWIRNVQGTRRQMRLIAAPVCVGNRVTRLVGIKRPITNRKRRNAG